MISAENHGFGQARTSPTIIPFPVVEACEVDVSNSNACLVAYASKVGQGFLQKHLCSAILALSRGNARHAIQRLTEAPMVALVAQEREALLIACARPVEVSVHPQTGAVTIRARARYFESGKTTSKFEKLANELLARRSKAYRALAK